MNELLTRAAQHASSEAPPGFADTALRFTLLYRADIESVDAARAELEAHLGGSQFVLRPLPVAADPRILLLEFPGLERQQSAELLFQCAQELTDALELEECVPDLDPGWLQADELGRDAPESAGGLIGRLCNSSAPPPQPRDWAVRLVRAREAWATYGTRGAGIRVAQPDTGIADHRELDGAAAGGTDVLAGGGPPVDPLIKGNRGHGTATASVVASRDAGLVIGTAPDAVVVPYRCINNVVISSGAAVAAAIDLARRDGCHVVTMSLGGPVEYPDLRRAIGRAVEAGMIVLAAAGNCWPWVVYPAWDQNVIAVGGVDAQGRPWVGGSRGDKIDVAGPAENVWVARRSAPADVDRAFVNAGQGTSFAVAATAGCAALWLAHHGIATVTAFAAGRGVPVQELFRAALRQTARRPEDWPERLGVGIVDAARLLSFPLDQIDLQRAGAAHANPGLTRFPEVADNPRFAAEAGFLAMDGLQRLRPDHLIAIETLFEPQPSPPLRERLTETALPVPAAPAVITPLLPPEIALGRIARGGAGGGLEAARSADPETVRRSLAAGAEALTERFAARLEEHATVGDAELARLRETVRAAAGSALKALGAGLRPRDLAPAGRAALEALIRLEGRPAFRVRDGRLASGPELAEWASWLVPHRATLAEFCARVGRIDIHDGTRYIHVGTGSVHEPGRVLTNRHVIEAFADPIPAAPGESGWTLRHPVSICFADDAADEAQRFAVTGVVFAGPDRIGRFADPAKLDLAVLTIETSNGVGTAPTPLDRPQGDFDLITPLLVVGYPARPDYGAGIDPTTGQVSEPIWDRLFELFGDEYGVKYATPGFVDQQPGALPGDPQGWAFSHDATTLAGNSGSPVFSLGDRTLRGLHFGGAPLRQNLAHDLASVDRLKPGWRS